MPEIYTANVNVSVQDEAVVFDPTDPQFSETKEPETNGWILDLKGVDPDSAVLYVRAVNGSGTVVMVRSRPSGGPWTTWDGGRASWQSPTLEHGDDFEVAVEIEEANGAIRHGGSYFHVRDTGGGDDVT